VVYGLPRFAPVLDAVLDEIVIEAASMSEPVRERNPDAWELVRSRLPQVDTIPHDELKELTGDARLVIRTGEATPFANVVLRCGVPF
jgi:D-ribose pyranase